MRMPALFVSHGSPMFALEPGTTGPALTHWARAMETPPLGIVIMSPHWMADRPGVMTNPHPATWHDFSGFPAPLYRLQYPAPGAPELGHEVIGLLAQAGIGAVPDAERPLDHGAWVPLMHLFTHAEVPVVQAALPADAGPPQVLAMGRALASLRERGVLVIGSGSMTHNLRELFGGGVADASYVQEFSRWIEAAIVRNDPAAMLDYRQCAPHAQRAHPTEEHFLPIFFALGAGGWGLEPPPAIEWLSREVMQGSLAMDAFALSGSR